MRHKEFWLAMALGALGGGVAALLFAPQSGVSARKKLKHQWKDANKSLEEVAEYLRHQADRLADHGEKVIETGKQEAGPAMAAASDYVAEASKKARTRVRQLV